MKSLIKNSLYPGSGRFGFPLLLLLAVFFIPSAWAAEVPERGLSAAFNHPGLTIGPDEGFLSLPLTIRNTGRLDDSFMVEVVEKPAGWRAETRSFSSFVSGQFVPGLSEASLTLVAGPPEGQALAEGEYEFLVRISSLDGQLTRESRCRVTVRPAGPQSAVIGLSASHPQINGPSDGRFSFALDLDNQGSDETLISLSAEVPEGWEAYFQPAYEDKQIRSIQIPRGQKRSLNLDVKPAYKAEAGVFPLSVRADSQAGSARIDLSVELLGTYGLKLFPANELLSAVGEPGRPVSLGFFVMNEGTAIQREVRLTALTPDNWRVEIEPQVVRDLRPGRVPIPVTLNLTPPEGALIGDYGLGLIAEGEKSRSALDLRVTLKAKAAWAWLGVGIIVLTVAALAIVFRRLGRR